MLSPITMIDMYVCDSHRQFHPQFGIIYCISWEASMRAKQILCFYNSRIYGEDLASKINLTCWLRMLFVLRWCFCCFLFIVCCCPHCLWRLSVRSLFCFVVHFVLSSFAIISLGKRELVALLLLCSECHAAVILCQWLCHFLFILTLRHLHP